MNISTFKIKSNNRRLSITQLPGSSCSPVILFVHGGPGYGMSSALAKSFQEELPLLSRHYSWVFFDQRCAGKSLSHTDLYRHSYVEDYLLDIYTVTQHCLSYFQKQKVLLVCHSWGTHIGLKAILRWPQLYASYVGIGQVVNGLAGEKISYDYALKRTAGRFPKLHHSLREMGPPPHGPKITVPYLLKQRRSLSLTGGFEKAPSPLVPIDQQGSVARLISAIRLQVGMYLSVKRLWQDCLDVDFSVLQQLPVPAMFICGRYDYVTPSKLVTQWYRTIQSDKKLFLFSGSGHRPHLEEYALFERIMIAEKLWLTNAPTSDRQSF